MSKLLLRMMTKLAANKGAASKGKTPRALTPTLFLKWLFFYSCGSKSKEDNNSNIRKCSVSMVKIKAFGVSHQNIQLPVTILHHKMIQGDIV